MVQKNIQNYVEVFIDIPLDELERRDPKGIYKNYRDGKIRNVAGVDLKVDFPTNLDIHLTWSANKTINSMFQEILNNIEKNR